MAAVAFWDLLVDGADSIVFRLLYNDLRAVYEPAVAALAGLMAPEVSRIEAYRTVAAAVTAGDGAAARDSAGQLLGLASAEFEAFTQRMGTVES